MPYPTPTIAHEQRPRIVVFVDVDTLGQFSESIMRHVFRISNRIYAGVVVVSIAAWSTVVPSSSSASITNPPKIRDP